MKDFTFKAPSLFDASATATPAEEDMLHDARGVPELLAKSRRFPLWLNSELANKGYAASDPDMDEGGWAISVQSGGEGFVYVIASAIDGVFNMIVSEIGGATTDVGDAIEEILRNAREITELKVE
jgi:hypothetical protein